MLCGTEVGSAAWWGAAGKQGIEVLPATGERRCWPGGGPLGLLPHPRRSARGTARCAPSPAFPSGQAHGGDAQRKHTCPQRTPPGSCWPSLALSLGGRPRLSSYSAKQAGDGGGWKGGREAEVKGQGGGGRPVQQGGSDALGTRAPLCSGAGLTLQPLSLM